MGGDYKLADDHLLVSPSLRGLDKAWRDRRWQEASVQPLGPDEHAYVSRRGQIGRQRPFVGPRVGVLGVCGRDNIDCVL